MAYRQQLLLDHNDALSIEQTVSLLDSLPYLTSLDLELVNVLPGSYVSRLPLALATALRRNGRHVSHFGIKCCQLKTLESLQEEDKLPIPIHAAESETDSTVTTACPYFQLDECLIADAILSFPSLQSLSLSEVTYDTLSTYSPLFEAASSLAQLREVEISDTSGLNERWTRKALSSPLRSLRFISTGAGVSSPVQIS